MSTLFEASELRKPHDCFEIFFLGDRYIKTEARPWHLLLKNLKDCSDDTAPD